MYPQPPPRGDDVKMVTTHHCKDCKHWILTERSRKYKDRDDVRWCPKRNTDILINEGSCLQYRVIDSLDSILGLT